MAWKKRDPIELFKKQTSDFIDFQEIEDSISLEIEEAFQKAKFDPFPEPNETYKNIYANS